jgi:translocation protein SEC62
MYAGNMVWSNIATGAVIIVVIGFTLLPIWPELAKKILWYCSVTFLIATLAFCLIRFLIFLLLWLVGYEFWIFPRLFDESLSFQDSFKPIYSFDKGSPGQGYYRIGVLILIGGFVYWACTQPTEFDEFLKAQKDFIDDIYSGNLLADVAQEARDNIDRTRRIPNIEDLLREMAEEERIDSQAFNPPSDNDVPLQQGEKFEYEVKDDGDSHVEDDHDEIDDKMFDELLSDNDEEIDG